MEITEEMFNGLKGSIEGLQQEIGTYKQLVEAYKEVAEQTGETASVNYNESKNAITALEQKTNALSELLSDKIAPSIDEIKAYGDILGEIKTDIGSVKNSLGTLYTKEDGNRLEVLVQDSIKQVETGLGELQTTYKDLVDTLATGFNTTYTKIDELAAEVSDKDGYTSNDAYAKENITIANIIEQMKRIVAGEKGSQGSESTMAAMNYFIRFGGEKYMSDRKSFELNGVSGDNAADSRYLKADKTQQIINDLTDDVDSGRISAEEKQIVMAILIGNSDGGNGQDAHETG